MISSDDHPGLFTFMVGVIVVVLAGVGLSLLVDKKFHHSKSTSSISKEIETGRAELEESRSWLERRASEFARIEPKLRRAEEAMMNERKKSAELVLRRKALTARRDELGKELTAEEEAFSSYRRKYRESERARAAGEKLGSLTIRGGKEYQNAVISQVTEVGLEIRHEHGIARVRAQDLPSSLQDRFQWSGEEQQARLRKEDAEAKAMEPVPVADRERLPAARGLRLDEPDGDEKKVSLLRAQVVAWKSRVSAKKSEYGNASSRATYNREGSVPGSLETWQSKADRCAGELAKARAELAAAKALLAAVSPNDPLLQSSSDEP